jgi:4-hydroxy-3-methylbut-2-enyl diphosphate reductase
MKAMMKPMVRLAPVLGMDVEARSALWQLEALAKTDRLAVAGRFMPDPEIRRKLREYGIVEDVEEADFSRFRKIVVPFCGVSPLKRREWEKAGVMLLDLTSPQVKRAQVALGLLRMDGAQPLVIGRHSDPESKGLAGGHPGTRILEDTTDTARLVFAPSFGVVCQTILSPRKVSWLVQQLRHRYYDAKVTFLDTLSPGMGARERALEKLLVQSDRVVIVGQPGEASCEALAETVLRKGRNAEVVASAAEAALLRVEGGERIALTAGAFALDETIRAVSDTLAGRD